MVRKICKICGIILAVLVIAVILLSLFAQKYEIKANGASIGEICILLVVDMNMHTMFYDVEFEDSSD